MLHRSSSWPGGQRMKPVPWDDQTTLSQTPICRTHPTSSSRWMTLQPAGVSCAEGAPPAPLPSVRSRSVNQRLFIAGTLPCPRSQPSLAPSVPGLWRRNSAAKVGSHWPAAPSRPCGPDLGPETDPSPPQSGHGRKGLVHVYWKLTLKELIQWTN